MQINYVDIHSHLNLSPLLDNEEVVARIREKGVVTITVGTDYETSRLAVETAEKFPDVALGATVGLHPNDNEIEIFQMDKYRTLAKHPRVVAIGETGLDYFRTTGESAHTRQKDIFKKHIELAIELKKPLMIHARPSQGSMNAYEDALAILESYTGLMCNFHFFVGDKIIAERIVKNGWMMSYDGPITFSSDYDEVIKSIPLENIMAETDAPFAAPAPYRGKTCEPWMVEEVYKKIAAIKGEDEEVVRKAIISNAARIFSLHID